ncbi:leucine-rich repeat domain-containing protein [Nannocystis pusilla]|uniref:leucine-rich repeat domain-containing protein n=1 Tax=Nannocystis pusilla TaxID=889268 RepID=UPI003B804F2D
MVAAPEPERVPPPPEKLVVSHPRELAELDLGRLVSLDLALSPEDRRERASQLRDDLDYDHACAELDLTRLAERTPALRTLRISGCLDAVHAGLGALVGVESLELADVTLDGVVMGRIASLPRLRDLTLARVTQGAEPVALLARAALSLVLRDLATDSGLAAIAGDVAGLQALTLEGQWAGHDALLEVAEATALRDVKLLDTRAGNFSLHQLKPLTGLSRLTLRGPGFNDYSPLYVRDLPLTEFTCACPNLGDKGLRALGRQPGLRRLVLPQSRITGAGLEELAKLGLQSIEIRGRDLGPDGLLALSRLPDLRTLVLGLAPPLTLADPAMQHLGELAGLRTLVLDIPSLGDRVADELGELVGLVELDLGRTQISDNGLRALAGMHGLKVLRLHHTKVTHRGLAHLAGLTQLEVLELDHTDVVDGGVAHLKDLAALRVLRLDATLITDQSLQYLRGMDKLEQLNLADTVVTADGAATLLALPSLRSVNLARTRASD